MMHRLVLISSTLVLLAAGDSLPAASVALVPHPAAQDLVRESGRLSIPPGTRDKVLDVVPEGGFAEGREYTFRIRYAKCQFDFATGREYLPPASATLGKAAPRPTPEAVTFAPLAESRSKIPYGIRATEASPQITDRRANSSSLALNFLMPPQTFATIDNVARWQEKEARALRTDLEQACRSNRGCSRNSTRATSSTWS